MSCPEKRLHSMSFGFRGHGGHAMLSLASLATSANFEIFDTVHHTCIKLQYSSSNPGLLIFDFNAAYFIFSISAS